MFGLSYSHFVKMWLEYIHCVNSDGNSFSLTAVDSSRLICVWLQRTEASFHDSRSGVAPLYLRLTVKLGRSKQSSEVLVFTLNKIGLRLYEEVGSHSDVCETFL
jgi:hypothetical protein